MRSINVKISRDPNDDFLLEMCVGSKAEIIITGNEDLLVLKNLEKTVILDPKSALTLL